MHIKEKALDKFSKSLRTEDMIALRDTLIYQDADGTYNLYDSYTIRKKEGYCEVDSTTLSKPLNFNNVKNAVTWCNFDKRNRISDSKRIIELDARLSGIETDIQLQQKLAKTAKDVESKLIHLAKLGEFKLKKVAMVKELTSYIDNSTHWQLGKFAKKTEH